MMASFGDGDRNSTRSIKAQARSQMATQEKSTEIPALSGLRFCAALYVFFFHYGAGYSARHHFPVAFSTFLENGFTGVTFFFVLSGFILTYTYRDFLDGRIALKRYFVARFARMYPVYLLALLIAAPFWYKAVRPMDVVRMLSLTQSWGASSSPLGYVGILQAWTLSVEMFFYLVFPWLLRGAQRLRNHQIVFGIGVMYCTIGLLEAPVLHVGMSSVISAPLFLPVTLLRLPEFALGVLIGQYVLNRGREGRPIPQRRWPHVLFLAACCVVLFATNRHGWVSFAAAGVGSLIYCAAGQAYIPRLALGNRCMVVLGGASYAMYLLQEPVRIYTANLVARRYPSADPFIALLALLCLSVLIFYFYEQPARSWLRKTIR